MSTLSPRQQELLSFATTVRGFMPDDEGLALFEAGREACRRFPGGALLEVGAWCGKSGVYLGASCEGSQSILFSLDHHRGSEENQVGWEHHDDDLVDPVDNRLNTLPHWQRSVADAGLEESVVGLVGHSHIVARHWTTPLSLLFIDGGHVPGWKPSVDECRMILLEIFINDPWPPDMKVTESFPIMRLWSTVVAHNFHINSVDDSTLFGSEFELIFFG